MAWRIGVDIGGTFTDVAMVEEGTGRIEIAKVPTTPLDFAQGVMAGVSSGMEKNRFAANAVSVLAHATTVVTNALLEHKGANAGFVGTRGFRDILELRRSSRSSLYDLFQDGPSVLVPRRDRFEITERIDAQGEVVTPLAESEIPALIEAIRASGVRTLAISLIFSFLNDKHERQLGERIAKALPDLQIFLSCDVLPEIREFERASTTAVCAFVGPLLESYLNRLQEAVSGAGLPEMLVMGSSGAVFDIQEALRMPAACVESGPAAGVIAAALVGRQLDVSNLISFDMGGTTAKASVIVDGEIEITADYEVGGAGHGKRWVHGTGHPIRVPVVDLAEVSSGGGSIAWIDAGGSLRVGPHSAGALPGPASYGRGGTHATVTDANVVLGLLDRDALLGGDLMIDLAAAEAAIKRDVADPLQISVEEAAVRVVEIVNASMVEALRMVSIEKGYDPREFSLVCFGGAGPVHAVALAEELKIPQVIVPPAPGAFSALGLVSSDLRRDYARTFFQSLRTCDPDRIAGVIEKMEASGRDMLDTARVPKDQQRLQRWADVRYQRQAYELTIPMSEGPITRESLSELSEAFHKKHEQVYGHADLREDVHIVNLRVSAIGRQPDIPLTLPFRFDQSRNRRRDIRFPATKGMVSCPVLWRESVRPGSIVPGPVVFESLDSTMVVPAGWTASVNERGYILVRKQS